MARKLPSDSEASTLAAAVAAAGADLNTDVKQEDSSVDAAEDSAALADGADATNSPLSSRAAADDSESSADAAVLDTPTPPTTEAEAGRSALDASSADMREAVQAYMRSAEGQSALVDVIRKNHPLLLEAFNELLASPLGFEWLSNAVVNHLAAETPSVTVAPKTVATPGWCTTSLAAQLVGIKPSDVLDFSDYPDRVVVITVDGRKLDGDRP